MGSQAISPVASIVQTFGNQAAHVYFCTSQGSDDNSGTSPQFVCKWAWQRPENSWLVAQQAAEAGKHCWRADVPSQVLRVTQER